MEKGGVIRGVKRRVRLRQGVGGIVLAVPSERRGGMLGWPYTEQGKKRSSSNGD